MDDHTHSDYADGFDAGVEAGAQQFRDFLARHAPVYVKDIQQWHRDFLAARTPGVTAIPSRNEGEAVKLLERIARNPENILADTLLRADLRRFLAGTVGVGEGHGKTF